MPDITTVNMDARVPFSMFGSKNTYMQFNISNLTNTRQPYRVSSQSNVTALVVSGVPIAARSFFYFYNSPRTFTATLHAEF
jgi:outer membrane receptor protein involved in Fe transport